MSQNRKKPQLIRVGTVSPGNAELCAIRLLLMATRGKIISLSTTFNVSSL